MKTFLKSLYGRISVAYLLLLLVFCAASIVVTLHTSQRYMQEADQRLNQTLAPHLAREIGLALQDSLNLVDAERAMHDLMVQNPRVEIYLLDEQGEIITFVADANDLKWDRVPMEPIHVFLDGTSDLPILGVDPRAQAERKVFSVAPVPMGNNRGFVYIILRSQQLYSVAAMVKGSYILRAAAVFLLLVFVFTALAGLLLFALMTKRIRRVVRAARSFKDGRLEHRVDVKGNDQLAQLERAFNEMASSLETNVSTLTSREDLRREFIANISHDLKSPLTSIQGYLETAIMKNATLSDEKRLEYLQIVLEETELLDRLISQLLELSKLEATGAHPDPEPFFVCELVQDVMMHFRPIAHQLGVTLSSPLSYDLPMVYADIGMIERVLSNLIDNALRHTPEGGRVLVDGDQLPGKVRVFVKDTGSGILPDDLARVTDRFYKGKSSDSRLPGSTGLGLAIAKQILRLHESRLFIESTVNEGTTVSFDLRLALDGHERQSGTG